MQQFSCLRAGGASRSARGIVTAILSALLVLTAPPAPAAAAAVDLAVGMKVVIGRHECSLGFFGFNADQDRLAVTAGHCSDAVDQTVYSEWGAEIGRVVSMRPDSHDADGNIAHQGPRGYTLIALSNRLSLEPFFVGIGEVDEGDYLAKFGQRSGMTQGRVIGFVEDPSRPGRGVIDSDLVIIPGDSGSPWYTEGPTGPILVGISSSTSQATLGGRDGGSQAQPIWDVIRMIRESSWGTDFKVWQK